MMLMMLMMMMMTTTHAVGRSHSDGNGGGDNDTHMATHKLLKDITETIRKGVAANTANHSVHVDPAHAHHQTASRTACVHVPRNFSEAAWFVCFFSLGFGYWLAYIRFCTAAVLGCLVFGGLVSFVWYGMN